TLLCSCVSTPVSSSSSPPIFSGRTVSGESLTEAAAAIVSLKWLLFVG
uniref:Uncharacterized protein n=1 Tax=Amphimedon queenslandica TaxID=400682 RepID=A0A1X7TQ79_AMPQE